MAAASVEARTVLTEIIAELEGQHDEAIAQLAAERAALRRQADATEEALWQRTDVLIEVEPMHLVRWRAKVTDNAARLLSPGHGGSGGISLLRRHRDELQALERRRAEEALEQARRDEAVRAEARARQAKNEAAKKSSPQPPPDPKPSKFGTGDLPKASPFLRKLAAETTAAPPAPPPSPAPLPTKAPVRPAYSGKLTIERDMLAAMLEGLVETGQKFFPGSRKYQQNQEERAALASRIAALDTVMAGGGAPPEIATIRSMPKPPDAGPLDDQLTSWSADRVEILRRMWLQGKSTGEITKAIGEISRNAVISKARRLGLPMRPAPERAEQSSGGE